MEQTTLLQRIEERAKKRLENDLVNASNQMREIGYKFGFEPQLNATWYGGSGYGNQNHIRLNNDFTKEIYEHTLPKYITIVTDEILRKIDEIDYLVSESKQAQTDDY